MTSSRRVRTRFGVELATIREWLAESPPAVREDIVAATRECREELKRILREEARTYEESGDSDYVGIEIAANVLDSGLVTLALRKLARALSGQLNADKK